MTKKLIFTRYQLTVADIVYYKIFKKKKFTPLPYKLWENAWNKRNWASSQSKLFNKHTPHSWYINKHECV